MTKLLTKWRDLTLVRPIELGGMADIYVALSPEHERMILRRLKSEFISQRRIKKQFINGIEILSRLSHPAIIPFIEGGYDDDNVPYLLVSYFESKTLRQRLCAKDPLLHSHLLMILTQLAEGLDYIHWSGRYPI